MLLITILATIIFLMIRIIQFKKILPEQYMQASMANEIRYLSHKINCKKFLLREIDEDTYYHEQQITNAVQYLDTPILFRNICFSMKTLFIYLFLGRFRWIETTEDRRRSLRCQTQRKY